MRTLKIIKLTICFMLVCSFVSCSDDDLDLYLQQELLGDYKRSDATENNGFELYLRDNETDLIGITSRYFGGCKYSETIGGEVCILGTSSVDRFTWSVKNNVLTLKYVDEVERVAFSIDESGNLHLSEPSRLTEYKNLCFIKIN